MFIYSELYIYFIIIYIYIHLDIETFNVLECT